MNNLSLFSGGGIGELAAHEAGITTVAMCESDEWCRYALERLWPGVPVFEDIRTLTVESLRGRGAWPIDIISGGFPCVDISCAGKGAGIHAERSGLWFEMLRLVREVRPRWVLAENVPALRTRGADIVLDGLAAAGYTAWPVVVGAETVGAPHRRERVWIVANANCDGLRRQDVSHKQERSAEAVPVSEWAAQTSWPPRPGLVANIPRAPDGLPGGIPTSARRALLRTLGNSWVPSCAYLIYKWIVEQERMAR